MAEGEEGKDENMTTMKTIRLKGYHCYKCDHEWIPRKDEMPRCCPSCHVVTYDKKPKRMRV